MGFTLIRRLVEQEGNSFQQLENRWRPQKLLWSNQVRALIRDVETRFERISETEVELATLDRRDLYIKYLRRMRLDMRTALFSWKADQLRFMQAVTQFYSDYATVLRLVKFDILRGKLSQPT